MRLLAGVAIVSCVGLGLLGAGFYVATTEPIFVARTQILIEPRIPQLLQQQMAEVTLSLDTAQIESQIAVLQSEKIATMVITELELLDDPKFNRLRSPSMSDRLKKMSSIVIEAFRLRRWNGSTAGEPGLRRSSTH